MLHCFQMNVKQDKKHFQYHCDSPITHIIYLHLEKYTNSKDFLLEPNLGQIGNNYSLWGVITHTIKNALLFSLTLLRNEQQLN